MNNNFSVGIDLGSRAVKIGINNDGEYSFKKFDTAEFYKKFIKRENGAVFIDIEALDIANADKIVATGYGRNLLEFANAEIVTEIKAHFKGALKHSGLEDFILIDIGGQDCKVILAQDGYIEDFLMNDKCAASTGRFIENVANVLGISLEEISKYFLNPATLSSTCAVFCESEVIGLLASGETVESISAGVNAAMAKKIAPLVKSYIFKVNKKKLPILLSGGVAKNVGLVAQFEQALERDIEVLPNPEYNGVFGII